MKDTYLDVRLELNEDALLDAPDPTAFVIETSRAEADRLCAENGAHLRTDRAPEVYLERGQHRLTGERCLLIATRWACVAPENVPVGPPR